MQKYILILTRVPTHRGATTFEVDKMAFEMKKRA